MCNATNKQAENLLKGLRKIDAEGFEVIDNSNLAETMVQLYMIKKELEDYEKTIKKELVERKISLHLFPELERKIYLSEGNARTETFVKGVYADAANLNLLNEFWNATTVSKTKLPETLHDSFNKNSEIKISEEKIVKVAKMNKQELLESKTISELKK